MTTIHTDLVNEIVQSYNDEIAETTRQSNRQLLVAITQYGLTPALAMILDPTGKSAEVIQSLIDGKDTVTIDEITEQVVRNLAGDDAEIGVEKLTAGRVWNSSEFHDYLAKKTSYALFGLRAVLSAPAINLASKPGISGGGTIIGGVSLRGTIKAAVLLTALNALISVVNYWSARGLLWVGSAAFQHGKVACSVSQVEQAQREITELYQLAYDLGNLKLPTTTSTEEAFAKQLDKAEITLAQYGINLNSDRHKKLPQYKEDMAKSPYEMVAVDKSGWTESNTPLILNKFQNTTHGVVEHLHQMMLAVKHDVHLTPTGFSLVNRRFRIFTAIVGEIESIIRDSTVVFKSLKKFYK